MGKEKDIFDKLMHLPVLNIFEPFYAEHKEILLYLFFGGFSFFLNMGLYFLFKELWGINELIANAYCWFICVSFQFFTNRTWVFGVGKGSAVELIRQLVSFFAGRVCTLLVEELILAIFITWLGFNSMIVKLIAQVVVIVSNYLISKLWVFSK